MRSETQPADEKREVLEVPSKVAREKKFLVDQTPPTRRKPTVRSVPRNTQLFERLQSFLPSISKANEQLDSTEACEIEAPGEESEGPVIELDLACGLFDLKNEAAVFAAQRAIENQAPQSNGGTSDDESDEQVTTNTTSTSAATTKEGEESETVSGISVDGAGKSSSGAEPTGSSRSQKRKHGHHPGIEEIS